ncbi:MAG TPA: hypothetical protein VGU72_04275 [Beijerinckiaceae bacterium]|jgi:hypothetical protein|nr:hypothetical protein [Beijerinckiaceae bacterium]
MNEEVLFSYLRRAPFGEVLYQKQIDGIKRILAECDRWGVTDLRHRAYILADAYWETGRRMQPVREANGRSTADTIARLDRAWAAGKLGRVSKPYWRTGKFGRGDTQLTHEDLYFKVGMIIGVDLVNNPDKALDPAISARIIVQGMRDGWFTGKKLSNYFNSRRDDPVAARAIVNGSDKAHLIAGFYRNFLDALKAADKEHTPTIPADVSKREAEADDVPVSQSKSLWTIVTTFFGGTFSIPFIGDVNNGYALAVFVLLLIAGCIFGYLIMSGRLQINRRAPDVVVNRGSGAVDDLAGADGDGAGGVGAVVGADAVADLAGAAATLANPDPGFVVSRSRVSDRQKQRRAPRKKPAKRARGKSRAKAA